MSALRTGLNDGLGEGATHLEGRLNAHLAAASQVLSIIGSNISYLCSFCPFGLVIMWHHLANTLDRHYCMERVRLVKGNDGDDR
jgi:hypothetical protein